MVFDLTKEIGTVFNNPNDGAINEIIEAIDALTDAKWDALPLTVQCFHNACLEALDLQVPLPFIANVDLSSVDICMEDLLVAEMSTYQVRILTVQSKRCNDSPERMNTCINQDRMEAAKKKL